MKLFIIAGLILTVVFLYAGEKEKPNIDEIKAKVSTNLNKRIEAHQIAKTCVDAATTMPELKKCRETLRASIKTLREETKEGKKASKMNKEAKIDNRIKKLEEKKAKLKE
ncbi:MAG: hypothetical protein HQK83_20000 [Fibrobacteria bacterium]|nr:hypothetical protein [Fibrobacteria bacterium]